MAKVRGPLFSLMASGSFGELVFDRRGFVRPKGIYRDRKTASQGNFRQALTAAQRGAKVCGPTTRQRLREVADIPSRWSAYLTKFILGPRRSTYQENLALFHNGIEPEAWETAATEIGLRQIHLNYADEAPVSAGAQLFMLAVTLYDLGIYGELPHPVAGQDTMATITAWQERITT